MNKLKSHNGFTLIELILTMTIAAILSAVAIPAIGNLMQTSALDSVSRVVQNDLRYAQMLAQTTGDSYGFRTVSNTTYEVYNVATGVLVTSPADQMPLRFNVANVYDGLHFGASNYAVVFDGVGRPTNSLTVQVLDKTGTKSQNIQISLNSGLVMRNNPTCQSLGC